MLSLNGSTIQVLYQTVLVLCLLKVRTGDKRWKSVMVPSTLSQNAHFARVSLIEILLAVLANAYQKRHSCSLYSIRIFSSIDNHLSESNECEKLDHFQNSTYSFVITSYSIHYTKLYECRGPGPPTPRKGTSRGPIGHPDTPTINTPLVDEICRFPRLTSRQVGNVDPLTRPKGDVDPGPDPPTMR